MTDEIFIKNDQDTEFMVHGDSWRTTRRNFLEIWSVALWSLKEISHTSCSMKHVIILVDSNLTLKLNETTLVNIFLLKENHVGLITTDDSVRFMIALSCKYLPNFIFKLLHASQYNISS